MNNKESQDETARVIIISLSQKVLVYFTFPKVSM